MKNYEGWMKNDKVWMKNDEGRNPTNQFFKIWKSKVFRFELNLLSRGVLEVIL